MRSYIQLDEVIDLRELPRWLMIKNPPTNAGDLRDVGLIPGSGRSPGGRNGKPLQHSCLEDAMDRETRQAIVHGVTKESDVIQ